jgi:hypothetical protein
LKVDAPLDAIAHVLTGKELDADLLKRIGSTRKLTELKDDLAEIAY